MELFKEKIIYFSYFQASDQKTFFYKCFSSVPRGLRLIFKNRKQNHQNRKWNYFSHFQASDKKTGNGIIFLTFRPLTRIFFYKIFLICSKVLKIEFQNWKWNYSKRKLNYLSYVQYSNQKILFKNT